MATLNEKNQLRLNPHLRDRIAGALSTAAEDVRNEQQDFTVVAATDIFTTDIAHGYADGNKIELAGDSLPSGVIAATTYFIRDQTANTFKLSETSSGAAIDITADGFGQIAVEHHPARFVWASNVLLTVNGSINEALRAHQLVVQNTIIADGYIANWDDGGPVIDGDVQFVVNGLVNILAGVES